MPMILCHRYFIRHSPKGTFGTIEYKGNNNNLHLVLKTYMVGCCTSCPVCSQVHKWCKQGGGKVNTLTGLTLTKLAAAKKIKAYLTQKVQGCMT